ncbi:MAG: hypothetical protein U0840_08940 [Gemmataceae bacterium]
MAQFSNEHSTSRRRSIKASRPALIDLRFKGDAWVVARGDRASVCLGDYPLTTLDVSTFDLPSLNRVLAQVRTGQARRNYVRKIKRFGA